VYMKGGIQSAAFIVSGELSPLTQMHLHGHRHEHGEKPPRND
jgi:hypothetical protein